jgi:hypothetical protein
MGRVVFGGRPKGAFGRVWCLKRLDLLLVYGWLACSSKGWHTLGEVFHFASDVRHPGTPWEGELTFSQSADSSLGNLIFGERTNGPFWQGTGMGCGAVVGFWEGCRVVRFGFKNPRRNGRTPVLLNVEDRSHVGGKRAGSQEFGISVEKRLTLASD